MNLRPHLNAGLAVLLAMHGMDALAASPASVHDNRSWRQPQAPLRIYGNTWYVGSQGLSAVLITSPAGHILIDGTLPENAPMIEANIRALGFRVRDIKLILNSHAHGDHAGAIAALAHDSGATVMASAKSARAMRLGGDDPDDPQHGIAPLYPAIEAIQVVADKGIVRVGSLALQSHATPGHTPGSTTWTWRSCESGRCLSMVYADSLSLLSADGYRYTDPAHPERLRDFRKALAMLAALPCDILITPHPDAVDLLPHLAQRKPGNNPLIDSHACKAYAAQGRLNMEKRISEEAAAPAH